MGNVLVKEETLTAIADSIRSKNGSDSLYKPGEMPDAIRNISTSEQTVESVDPEAPIRFFGMDGELLYSYSLVEVQQLTELPPLPYVEGFICEEWNWTLEDIQAMNRAVNVGAIFITDDGATRIHVNLTEGCLDPYVGFAQETANSVMVDWGDGSPLESSDAEGSSENVHMQHIYSQPGNYVIRLLPNKDAKIHLKGASYGTLLLHQVTDNIRENRPFGSCIRRIELGSNIENIEARSFNSYTVEYVTIPKYITNIRDLLYDCRNLRYIAFSTSITSLAAYLFRDCKSLSTVAFPSTLKEIASNLFASCYSLESVTLPDNVDSLTTFLVLNCYKLKTLTIPKGLTIVPSSTFNGCSSLKEVILHEGVLEIGSQAFYECTCLEEIILPSNVSKLGSSLFCGCYSLRKLEIPDKITQIPSACFQNCYSLAELTIPSNITSIGSNAFLYCYGMKNYFLMSETPPTLLNANAFTGISETCKIHVPKGCLEAYQTATNWSTYADYMVEMEGADEETE